jgi:hypothetical protein
MSKNIVAHIPSATAKLSFFELKTKLLPVGLISQLSQDYHRISVRSDSVVNNVILFTLKPRFYTF